jgi:flagellar biosynthesis/type III secretory pathway M-ring protein FliF/YscJ
MAEEQPKIVYVERSSSAGWWIFGLLLLVAIVVGAYFVVGVIRDGRADDQRAAERAAQLDEEARNAEKATLKAHAAHWQETFNIAGEKFRITNDGTKLLVEQIGTWESCSQETLVMMKRIIDDHQRRIRRTFSKIACRGSMGSTGPAIEMDLE